MLKNSAAGKMEGNKAVTWWVGPFVRGPGIRAAESAITGLGSGKMVQSLP